MPDEDEAVRRASSSRLVALILLPTKQMMRQEIALGDVQAKACGRRPRPRAAVFRSCGLLVAFAALLMQHGCASSTTAESTQAAQCETSEGAFDPTQVHHTRYGPLIYRFEYEGISWNILKLFRPTRMTQHGATLWHMEHPGHEPVLPTDAQWQEMTLDERIVFIKQYLLSRQPQLGEIPHVAWNYFVLVDAPALARLDPQLQREGPLWEVTSHRDQPHQTVASWRETYDSFQGIIQNENKSTHAWVLFPRKHTDDRRVRERLSQALWAYNYASSISAYAFDHLKRNGAESAQASSSVATVLHPLVGLRAADFWTVVDETLDDGAQLKWLSLSLRTHTTSPKGIDPIDSDYVGLELRLKGRLPYADRLADLSSALLEAPRLDEQPLSQVSRRLQRLAGFGQEGYEARLSSAAREAVARVAAEVASKQRPLPDGGSLDAASIRLRIAIALIPWWNLPHLQSQQQTLENLRQQFIERMNQQPWETLSLEQQQDAVVDSVSTWAYHAVQAGLLRDFVGAALSSS